MNVSLHDTTSIGSLGQVSEAINHTAVDNLIPLLEAEDKEATKDQRNQLVSLLNLKIQALEKLAELQAAYNQNVEGNDALAVDDLNKIQDKIA
jgi:hypothetical protein